MRPPIRAALTLWQVAFVAVVLLWFSTIFYVRVRDTIQGDLNERLISRSDRVAESIYTFWRGEWRGRRLGTEDSLRAEIVGGRFSGLVNRWARDTRALYYDTPWRVLDRTGRHVLSNPRFGQEPTILPEPSSQKFTFLDTPFETGKVRLATRPVSENGTLLYYVQTWDSVEPSEKALRELRGWLNLIVPLILALSALIGWLAAIVALKPVSRIISKAQKIGAGRLSDRVDVPASGDELEALARTFNEMLDRLERGFKRQRQLTAVTSHELRTPLTIMKGELEVALRQPRESGEYEKTLKMQLGAVQEMESVVSQLLLLAHAEDGEQEVGRENLDLTGLAREVWEDWQPLAERKMVGFEMSSPGPVVVQADGALIQRLMHNLVDNAVKHTPEGGLVRLEIESGDREVRLKISDTGEGIPEEELPRIFDKFFSRRPKSGTSRSVGLGLGFCRWIVEAHHGSIDVRSAPGSGTVFTVRLPK